MRVKFWEEWLAEIAYILMAIFFLIIRQYLIVIALVLIFIFATKLQNAFRAWVLRGDNNG